MRTRILPREEWDRLDESARALFETLAPEDVAVVVVESAGEIVARIGVMRAIHWEGFWMTPKAIGNAGITRALIRAATAKAAEWTENWLLAHARDEATGKALERLGGQWLDVHTFLLPLKRLETEETCRLQSGCQPPPA